jgi:radical SAM superfamily enzyme YgiQ (UPF0313 family)
MNKKYKHVLLIYPKFPPTYWGSQYYLPLVGKKAAMPPLGLITIAAMMPEGYEVRLVDLACRALEEADLEWADMVCLSAMLTQKSSLFETARRCRAAGKLVVFGGPYPTACPEECAPYCDVLILNEGEITWRAFLHDLEAGNHHKVYTTPEKPDVTQTPVPRFDLLEIDDYAMIPVQFSRGCPYLCEFCDITVLFGRRPRTKTPPQMLAELDGIRETGFRGVIFIVDDNFIGNKKEAKRFLRALIEWNAKRGHPFFYGTEVTVNLSDDAELLDLLVKANFIWVFMGIETPSEDSLKETRKVQNLKGSLVDRMKLIQGAGLLTYGSFIVGFDNDTVEIFDRQIDFITEAAIPNAMIGPLVALPGTPLFTRMKQSGRLIEEAIGDEERTLGSGYTNIVTRIPRRQLLEGHLRVIQTLYDPEAYFDRCIELFSRMGHPRSLLGRLKRLAMLNAFGIRNLFSKLWKRKITLRKIRMQYREQRRIMNQFPEAYQRASRRFTRYVIRHHPDQSPFIPHYITMGYHYYMFTFDHVVPALSRMVQEEAALEKHGESLRKASAA